MLVPVFFAVSVVIFLILHLIPGDPIDNLIRIGSGPEARATSSRRATDWTQPAGAIPDLAREPSAG